MATFTQTPELSGTITPTSAEGITNAGWGIDATLSGYIIQNITVTGSRVTDNTQDQKGAVIGELDYDQQWTLNFDVIGNPSTVSDAEDANLPGLVVGDTGFTFNGHKWKIDSVTYTGSFQDKKRWNVTAHRWANFPAQA